MFEILDLCAERWACHGALAIARHLPFRRIGESLHGVLSPASDCRYRDASRRCPRFERAMRRDGFINERTRECKWRAQIAGTPRLRVQTCSVCKKVHECRKRGYGSAEVRRI